MTVPTHFRFTVRGIFSNTPEIWSWGFHFNRNVDTGGDAGLGDIDEGGVTDAVTALLSQSLWESNVKATDWRAYVIGTNGKMEGNAPLLHDFGTTGPSGSSGTRVPPQTSLVVSLIAPERGPAKFGRCYLPGPSKGVSDDLRLTISDAGEYQAAFDTFLHSVSDSIDLPGSLGSSAAVNVSDRPAGVGTLQAIDHTEVGRCLDTMQTRRNHLLEDRVAGGHIDW